ncbi:hypothetical protein SAMN05192559_10612 [Halobacillus karajensis]|uniref:Uncharacterized protein n=1 Tax=Halobacillus karajensis TaxID=195088 RepID=A0A024P6S2_9BACI|nr:hypothetical protein BN982_03573 [Halobacillus karajensis]CDQ24729.1 hypothetical protein BN983_03025 [Halobacillus karajensis]CDQ28911.1 hypothetical protein BN981_03229 [Halobacillus karajensis]SEH94784.1 hypothetical protein SAMN05192559_10612 [Halobacillus karajensis]
MASNTLIDLFKLFIDSIHLLAFLVFSMIYVYQSKKG